MKTLLTILVAVTMTLILSGAAEAATNFAVTATANNSRYGYVQGQSYTFTWTIASSETASDDSYFREADGEMSWSEETTDGPVIFSDFTTGFGTYTCPADGYGDPYSSLTVGSSGYTDILVGNDGSYGIGVTTPDGASVNNVNFYGSTNIAWAAFDNFIDPVAYLADYAGTYTLTTEGFTFEVETTVSGSLNFTPTSLTIEAAPVPEPATMALLGLGGLLLRRKK